MSAAALLALVADDRTAQKVLAVWVSMKEPASTTDNAITDRCMTLGVGPSFTNTRQAVARLRAAGLIVDGGTTELGEKWLQTVAVNLIGEKPRKAKR